MTKLLFVTGTGTEIGKTHLAAALLEQIGRRQNVAGVKPVESGVADGVLTDGARLAAASTFHVKQTIPRYELLAPISPHLAARRAGIEIALDTLRAFILEAAAQTDVLLVELPGGLFTPLSTTSLNIDLAARFPDARIALIVPDRLGVLHDALAATRAARSAGVATDLVLVNSPAEPDPSTGTNAAELRSFLPIPVIGPVRRAAVVEVASSPEIREAAEHLLR